MKWFLLGGSRTQQLCLKPQRLSGGDESWNPFYCHPYEQSLEAFSQAESAGNQYGVLFVAHPQLFVFPVLS